jgi:hypothetical protein
VTGPSHAGKSAGIAQARRALASHSAFIAIDDIIASLDLGEDDLWEDGLPAAYDVAVASAAALLRRDFVVFVESTFTFVPPGKSPAIHPEQLGRLIDAAKAANAPWLVVRLTSRSDVLLRRREATGRLDPSVVRGTWRLHNDWIPGIDTHELDTSAMSPNQVTAALLDALGDLRPKTS